MIGPTVVNVRMKIFTLIGQTGGTTIVGDKTITFGVNQLPVYCKTDYLKILCVPTSGSGTSDVIATVNVYINQKTTPYNTVSVTKLMADSGIIDIPCTKVGVRQIQIEIVYPNMASIGTDDFAPSMAELAYTPILKRK